MASQDVPVSPDVQGPYTVHHDMVEPIHSDTFNNVQDSTLLLERPHVGPGADVQFSLADYEAGQPRGLGRSGSSLRSYGRPPSLYTNADLESINNGSPSIIDRQKPKPRFFKTRRRMCLCICCLIILILLAVMIPVIIFVIVPAVAQASVNASKMVITAASIVSPQEESFVMKMTGQVTDTGPFDATIEIKDKVSMYYEGIEIGQMALDPISAKAGVGATLDSSPTFMVTNKTAFGDFNKFMITGEQFTWTMKGQARVHAMGLVIDNIKLQKDLTLKGMHNFPGVKINSFDLPSNHPLGGITMNSESSMQNPSPFTVELGDLTFDINYNNLRIATLNVTGVTIVPGSNSLNMKGRMVPQSSAPNLATVSEMFSQYMGGQDSPMTVVGVSVRPNATAEPISWLQRGFAGTTLKVNLDGAKNIKLIQSVALGDMDMTFSAGDAWRPLTTANNVVAKFKMPFGFPLQMRRISQKISISSGGTKMANMATPLSPASGDSASGQLTTAIVNAPMEVLDSQHNQFSRFVTDLTMGPSNSMSLAGEAISVASTAIGDVTITGVKFTQDVTLRGLQGLQGSPITVDSLIVKGGTAEALEIALIVTIVNPSNVAMKAGDVYFDLFFQGQNLGKIKIPNMTLNRGSNSVSSTAYFSPKGGSAVAAGRKMLSDYVAGVRNTVGIAGASDSTDIASLKQALSGLKLSSVMPAINEAMLRNAKLAIDLGTIFTQKAKTQMDIYNPLDAPISLVNLEAELAYKGNVISTLSNNFGSSPLVLAPKSVTPTPSLPLVVKVNLDGIKAILAAAGGKLSVDVKSVITCRIGGYLTTLDYSQPGLAVALVPKL